MNPFLKDPNDEPYPPTLRVNQTTQQMQYFVNGVWRDAGLVEIRQVNKNKAVYIETNLEEPIQRLQELADVDESINDWLTWGPRLN